MHKEDGGGNFTQSLIISSIWDKVFKNEASKICGREPLKNLKEYDSAISRNTCIDRILTQNF